MDLCGVWMCLEEGEGCVYVCGVCVCMGVLGQVTAKIASKWNLIIFVHLSLQFQVFLFSLKIVGNFSFLRLKQSPLFNVEFFFSLGGGGRRIREGRREGGRGRRGRGRTQEGGRGEKGEARREDIRCGHNMV